MRLFKGHPVASALIALFASGVVLQKFWVEPQLAKLGIDSVTDTDKILSTPGATGIAFSGVLPQLVITYLAYKGSK